MSCHQRLWVEGAKSLSFQIPGHQEVALSDIIAFAMSLLPQPVNGILIIIIYLFISHQKQKSRLWYNIFNIKNINSIIKLSWGLWAEEWKTNCNWTLLFGLWMSAGAFNLLSSLMVNLNFSDSDKFWGQLQHMLGMTVSSQYCHVNHRQTSILKWMWWRWSARCDGRETHVKSLKYCLLIKALFGNYFFVF